VLAGATALLIAVGTVVTGAGPHAGDSSDVHRIPVDWKSVAQLHADLAWVVVALTAALWFVLRAVDAPIGPRDRSRDLFLVLMTQGVIGYVQYFTHLPEAVVGLHMFGASIIWIALLRLLLSVRERPVAEPGELSAAGVVRQPVDAARVHLADQGGDPLPVRR
jgi:cytochrome c oxidase assembly protein subunit 15